MGDLIRWKVVVVRALAARMILEETYYAAYSYPISAGWSNLESSVIRVTSSEGLSIVYVG